MTSEIDFLWLVISKVYCEVCVSVYLLFFYSYMMVLKNCLKYIFKNLAYFWKYEMCLYENYALSIIAWHLRESYVAYVEKNICFDEGNNGKDYD